MTLQIFFALVMFNFGALLAFLTLPFATLPQTKFLAERPVGWVFASGLKLASLAVVLSMSYGLIRDLRPSSIDEITILRSFTTILVCALLSVMSLLAPRIAADLLSGSPTLGFSDLSRGGKAIAEGVGGGASVAGGLAMAATGAGAGTSIAQAASAAGATLATGGQTAASATAGLASAGAGGATGGGKAVSFARSAGLREAAEGASRVSRAFEGGSSALSPRGMAPSPSF